MENRERFTEAIRLIDEANAADPRVSEVDGRSVPEEVLYAERMTARMERYAPDAPELVRLAARCQHICRWEIPRDRYPKNRAGYHQWRNALKVFHGEKAGELMERAGYSGQDIDRVAYLLSKAGLKTDADSKLLEDVVCLVFLEHYFDDFSRKHDEAKLIGIVQKTWAKMTPRAHEVALAEISYSPEEKALIEKALA